MNMILEMYCECCGDGEDSNPMQARGPLTINMEEKIQSQLYTCKVCDNNVRVIVSPEVKP